MKVKKVILSVLVLIAMFLTAVPVYAEDESEKDVETSGYSVTIEAGLDGVLVEDKASPVSITVKNVTEDFEGTLRVIVPATYDQKSLAYEKSIVVPKGGEKTFSILLPGISNVSFLRVELENSKGKTIYSKQEKIVSYEVGQTAVLGILSSDFTGLNYFDGVSVTSTNGIVSAKAIQLNVENIPEVSDGLEICDFILIDNYNTSQLSAEQRNAIVGWVNNGGVLIVGTGSKALSTLEGFTDTVCPVQTGALTKKTLDIWNTEPLENVDAVDITANGWNDVQGAIAYGAPAYQALYGGGSVLVLSYDLAMNPIANWNAGRSVLAENILSNAASDSVYDKIIYGNSDSYDSYSLRNAVEGADKNKIPNALLYGGIFFIYVLAIGPIAYLVLRGMDKREKIWIVMPAIALLFTIIILITSMNYKIRKPFIDAVSIIEFNNGFKDTKTYMSVQNPKGKAYSIDLSENYNQVASWNDDDVSYEEVGMTNYSHSIVDATDYLSVSMQPAMAFTKRNVMAEKQEYQQNAGFTTNLTCNLSGFEGTITNNTGYDLSNVVAVYNGQFIYMGEMKDGASAQVKAANLKSLNSLSWNMKEWLDKLPKDIAFFNYESDYLARNNQNVYEVMRGRAEIMEMNQGMIFGMVDDYSSDLVKGNNTKLYAVGVAVGYFHQVVEEYQNYTSFIDDINDYMVGGSNIQYSEDYPSGFESFPDMEDYDLYGASEIFVLYDFSSIDTTGAQLINRSMDLYSEDVDIDDFDSLEDYNNYVESLMDEMYNYEDYTKVQLFNYTTQQYEDVFVSGNIIEDMTPYINEKGWMQVRYYTDDVDTWGCYAPVISLVGGER